jgi:hypothetical protein
VAPVTPVEPAPPTVKMEKLPSISVKSAVPPGHPIRDEETRMSTMSPGLRDSMLVVIVTKSLLSVSACETDASCSRMPFIKTANFSDVDVDVLYDIDTAMA